MTRKLSVFLVATLAVAVCLSLGCSKSSTTQASFESSSKSSSSPFKSSSSSGGGDDDEESEDEAYLRDVTDYASSFDADEGDPQVFQRELSDIAETHGVTDWESHDRTYLAIGRGLARANLDDSGFERIAVELANEDSDRLAMMQAGFLSKGEGSDAR
jgi:hypothetical protein